MHTGEEMEIIWLYSLTYLIELIAVSFSKDGKTITVLSQNANPTKIFIMRVTDGAILRGYSFDYTPKSYFY